MYFCWHSIERVLHDLSLDQAISSAREFLKLSPNELGCRIEALIKASRLDNERADDLERHLNIKYVECEQLERKLARFEKESREQVAFVPETSIRVDNADRKGELATLIPKSNSLSIIPPPHSLSSYAAKTRPAVIPSAPPKFGGIQKKSFQVPDGFGGTKKIIQTKFGRIDN